MKVDGMMCQRNCGSTVQKALLAVAGVLEADVSFATGSAVVRHSSTTSTKLLLDAVDAVGFDCTFMDNLEPLFRLDVQGMMCQKNCATTVQNAIRGVEDVSWVMVSFPQKEAKVWGNESAADALLKQIIEAVEAVGFDAKMKTFKGKYCSSVPPPSPAAAPSSSSASTPTPSSSSSKTSSAAKPAAAAASEFPNGSDNSREVELKVGGMSCASCVRAVETGLMAVRGVNSVRVALLAEKVLALYDGDTLSAEEVARQVVSLGYTAKVVTDKSTVDVAKWKFVFEISGMSCASCATKIENTLAGLRGVADAAVSVSTSKAEVEVDDTISDAVGPRDLIEAVVGLGYGCKLADEKNGGLGSSSSEDVVVWGRLLVVSLLLGIPVMTLHMSTTHSQSVMMAMSRSAFCQGGITFGQSLMVALNLPLQFGVGYRFYRGAIFGAMHGNFGMDCLVVTGTSISFAYSSVQLAYACANHVPTTHVFFEASGMLLMFVTLGKFMEAYARGKSASAITNLLKLQPSRALLVAGGLPASSSSSLETLKHDSYGTLTPSSSAAAAAAEASVAFGCSEKIVEIDANLVQRGDVVKVLPGARIPTDGTVLFGSSYVDESMITGESVAVHRTKGDFCFGSTVNQTGLLYVKVTSVGSESALAQIVRLVESAQMNKAPVQKYADKIASVFTPIVLSLAALTFGFWATMAWAHKIPRSWFADEYGDPILFSMLFGISVIVISCPCALGLATPTAIMVGTAVGALNGILIKGGPAFEMAHSIDTVIFDKTGTLTEGKCVVTDVIPISSLSTSLTPTNFGASGKAERRREREQILRLAAMVEQGSEHPLAAAVINAAKAERIPIPAVEADAFARYEGQGVGCTTDEGDVILVGNRLFMQSNSLLISAGVESTMLDLAKQGKTSLCVAKKGAGGGEGGCILGIIGVADAPKAEARSTVVALQGMGIAVWMVTGDNRVTAEAIAAQVEIPLECVVASAMPADKVTKIDELKKAGKTVAMIGDGINDSPALARSDLGIAIGAGTHIAVDAADMVLVRSNLHDVVVALDLAKVVFNRIKLNFLWAIVYNIVAIPFAAGIWFPWTHMLVPPQYAGLCMALSSISVVVSSALLRLYQRPQILEGGEARVTLLESGTKYVLFLISHRAAHNILALSLTPFLSPPFHLHRRLSLLRDAVVSMTDKIRGTPSTPRYTTLSTDEYDDGDAFWGKSSDDQDDVEHVDLQDGRSSSLRMLPV